MTRNLCGRVFVFNTCMHVDPELQTHLDCDVLMTVENYTCFVSKSIILFFIFIKRVENPSNLFFLPSLDQFDSY